MRQSSPHSPASAALTRSEPPDLASCAIGAQRRPHILEGACHPPERRILPSMQSAVEQTVAALHNGNLVVIGRYPNGVYREISVLERLRDSQSTPKGLIAVATRYNAGKEETFLGLPTLTLVYFPTAADSAVYYRAGAASYMAGPADLYPGSVGVLQLVQDPESGIAQIVQLQSSVKVADPSVSKLLKQPGNSLCTRYQKWSSRLLERAFEHTRRLGISQIAVAPLPDTALPLSAPVRNFAMIRDKAKACGFTLSADRSLLIDTSSPK